MSADALPYAEPPLRWSDRRVERMLGTLVGVLLLFVGAMLVVVIGRAWPSFAHNGLSWFGAGGSVDHQIRSIFLSGDVGGAYDYTFHAWPLLWSTLLITGGAVLLAFVCSLFVAVFAVEFAPGWMRAVLDPVIRLLASVPSVIYGLLGVLVLVPFIGNHVIGEHQKASVAYVVSLSGYSLLAAILVLSVMIAPLMVAIFSDGLRSVPPGWLEGSLALGVNRWRTFWKIAVRTARPAFVAGTVLATARALGEAVMLAMVSGSVGFAPNPADGLIFLFEPSRPLAATILANSDELQLAADARDAVRDRRGAARLRGAAVARRLGRKAAAEALRGAGMSALASPPRLGGARRDAVESSASWRLTDRAGLAICWALGLLFCAITAAIVIFLLIQGIRYVRPALLVTHPSAGFGEADSGGFLDPLIGTLLVALIGIAIALPLGVATAVWLSEYGRPFGFARVAESAVEMLAGTPSIVLALFGTLIFSSPALGFLSRTSGDVVFGRSFFAAGAMLSFVALPLIVTATREGLQAIPSHVREASYAVGKTKAATIRRILLPSARPNVVTGTMLGIGRIIGDTSIIVVLLGATLTMNGVGGTPLLSALRGTGSTLTSYVYDNSPTGRGQPTDEGIRGCVRAARDRARAQPRRRGRPTPRKEERMEYLTPLPVRRLALDEEAGVVLDEPRRDRLASVDVDTYDDPPSAFVSAPRRRVAPASFAIERMTVEQLSIAYAGKPAVREVSLPIRQGEVLALIGPSGCGKTTLLRSLNRLTELTRTASLSGRVTLDGSDIATLEPTSLRRRVTMVFQQPNPFPMSVFDNVAYVLREQGSRRPKKRELRRAVQDALQRAGLWDEVSGNLDHPALRLSGGQQQRLCIARALAAQPEVLLLDEPCSALDPRSTEMIEELIVKLRDEVAIVIVTHNLQQAFRVADHVAFMYLGELVEYGPASAVFRTPSRAAHEGLHQRCVRLGAWWPARCIAAVLGGGLAGCATTQQQSARARVVARRVLATQRPLHVRETDRQIGVLGTALVRGHGRSAIVVRLRNSGPAPVSDLPLALSVRVGGGRVVALNRRAGLPYFQTHAPALAAGATVAWVFTTHARVPHGALVVRVGRPSRASQTATLRTLPRTDVALLPSARGLRSVRATIANRSGVPQYALEVYAVARRGRRIVAAGRALVAHLGSDGRTTVRIPLIGDARGATVRVMAPPTLFS